MKYTNILGIFPLLFTACIFDSTGLGTSSATDTDSAMVESTTIARTTSTTEELTTTSSSTTEDITTSSTSTSTTDITTSSSSTTDITTTSTSDITTSTSTTDSTSTSTSEVETTISREICGNGIIDGNEECDGSQDCNPDCTLSMCGDGFLNPNIDEECDDGNTEDKDECSNECVKPRFLFLLKKKIKADFGGVSQADFLCGQEASTYGLGLNYKAFLSDSNPANQALNRLTSEDFKGWYRTVNHTYITKGWSGLLDIKNKLNEHADGSVDSSTTIVVWSNTYKNGALIQANNPNSICNDWKSQELSKEITVWGNAASITEWNQQLNNFIAYCSTFGSLYCIEIE